jgi:hypothetical protein
MTEVENVYEVRVVESIDDVISGLGSFVEENVQVVNRKQYSQQLQLRSQFYGPVANWP